MEDEVYIRYLDGFRNRMESVWLYSPGTPESMQKRDSLMAQNLVWLVDSVYKDQKIIVWAANVHTLYQNTVQDIQFKSLAEYIKNKYGDESYMLVFTSYGVKNGIGELTRKASNKSIEYVFHQTQKPYFFIDMQNLPSKMFLKEKNVSVINQRLNIESNWSKVVDGIFYIDTMSYPKTWKL